MDLLKQINPYNLCIEAKILIAKRFDFKWNVRHKPHMKLSTAKTMILFPNSLLTLLEGGPTYLERLVIFTVVVLT